MTKYSSLVAALCFTALAIFAKLKCIPLEANFALFGALALFCGATLRGVWAWCLPLAGLAVSDFLGHWLQISGVYLYDGRAMFFNYAGFAAMIAMGSLVGRYGTLPSIAGSVLLGSLAFFLISNFGAWLDPLMGYEKSGAGLMHSYVRALPFFRTSLQSDVLFSGLMFGSHALFLKWQSVQSAERSQV